MTPKPAKAEQLDVVPTEPIDGCAIWFELSEVEVRLLAKGIVTENLRDKSEAAIGWLEGDPTKYLDRTGWPRTGRHDPSS